MNVSACTSTNAQCEHACACSCTDGFALGVRECMRRHMRVRVPVQTDSRWVYVSVRADTFVWRVLVLCGGTACRCVCASGTHTQIDGGGGMWMDAGGGTQMDGAGGMWADGGGGTQADGGGGTQAEVVVARRQRWWWYTGWSSRHWSSWWLLRCECK